MDENNHADRDPLYEVEREAYIKKIGCKFIRINPDADNFKLSSCIGIIMKNIMEATK